MKINHSDYTITELLQMFERKELIVNKSYQRGAGVWPASAKTYFIDTILQGFPFPKLYVYQEFDKKTRSAVKEIVDGQQRISAIREFYNNELRLNSASDNYKGLYYNDLDEDAQEKFLMYTVPADVILGAERSELLEMFRRINSYTAPLNPAEKRHSDFNGPFKWFINEVADRFCPTLQSFGVLTDRQIIRMGDAELLTELAQALDQGIVDKSNRGLTSIYKKFDQEFSQQTIFDQVIREFFEYLHGPFEPLRGSYIMKPYAFHSLFCAFTLVRHGLPSSRNCIFDLAVKGPKFQPSANALDRLLSLAHAHESKDIDGPDAVYVKACLSTTTKVAQRKARTIVLANAMLM